MAVRRELGADYEPVLVDAFLERIEAAVEARADARLDGMRARDNLDGRLHGQQLALGIVSLCAGIPITAIAGSIGGGLAGVAVSWAGIAAVNFAHALLGRRRK
jgi:hypothetical protein